MNFSEVYKGNLKWLPSRIILLSVSGSRAYGTSRPTSDYDYRGVAVPPRAYRDGFLNRFEQAEIKEPDIVVHELRKFMSLAADCNPNICEVLWVEPEDRLVFTEAGQLLIDHREKFLSQKASFTYRGYAMSQLKRIRSHRQWLLNPMEVKPTRKDFDLPERTVIPADQLAAASSNVQKKMDTWAVDYGPLDEAAKIAIQEQVKNYLVDLSVGSDDHFNSAARLLGFSENFLLLLETEKRYHAALRNWQQYQDWKTNRNETRAALEAKFHYDSKHGMHLVRLMKTCREILTEGKIIVRRPDAAELMAIRDGAWSFDKLIAWAEEQDLELQGMAAKSPLPKAPDRVFLDNLCQEVTALVENEC